jgi:hypothetical protein
MKTLPKTFPKIPIFKSRFYWKELSEDGLLKEPRKSGPYYDEYEMNNYRGFDSREEAFKTWATNIKKGHFLRDRFVLIEEFLLENEEDFEG